MEQPSGDAAAKAIAFASGLRKNITVAGRRWTSWPGGANQLASALARVEGIAQRLAALPPGDERAAVVATCIADLRTILEWTTYQSASLSTARAIVFARKTRTFAERFGLLDDVATSFSVLVDSEQSLIENVRTKNGYMIALAERNPHLELPPPLVSIESLLPRPPKPPGRLGLIQQLIKSAKENPRR